MRQRRLFIPLFSLFLCFEIGVANGENWIDVDTPEEKKVTRSFIDGSIYHLVMSDEFNVPNRTFTDGHDPMWTALDRNDDDSSAAGGGSLHFYNSSWATTTEEGYLKISSTMGKTEWDRYDTVHKKYKREVKHFKSAMIQGWNKFCFTGGIVEVDVIFPGRGHVGGLWPAVWMLGNLGRATYEASTNNIWPWSFDQCNRELQSAQAISCCNVQNHYGMHPEQGRGSTEIDIIEVMYGDPGKLPNTHVQRPYADMTLQVAPGISHNRPVSGYLPSRAGNNSHNYPLYAESTWYDGLYFGGGNTTLNPFFYGTYLAETKPGEPVTRNKKQAFQADAIGAMSQFVKSHFKKMHTYRLEWQPGDGGRIDWFLQGHKVNETFIEVGDGNGKDWYRAFSVTDKSLKKAMNSKIPEEPSYLIFNTAISTNWGFPYSTPKWCKQCYDCTDPQCACNFPGGFCDMMKNDDVAMYIDSVRVYQSRDGSAHKGQNHTLGCDLPTFPTREFIKGHEYRYSRSPPFSFQDSGSLKDIQTGGGECDTHDDCGGRLSRGTCGESITKMKKSRRALFSKSKSAKGCVCKSGFTGPHCLALDHKDIFPSAFLINRRENVFNNVARVFVPPFILVVLLLLVVMLATVVVITGRREQKRYAAYTELKESIRSPDMRNRAGVNIVVPAAEGSSIPMGRPVHVGDI